MATDQSIGYDSRVEEYIALRASTGLGIIEQWATTLPQGSTIVDIGAGHGEPLTSALIARGLIVSAIDASPKMVASFKSRFPDIEIACEAAQESDFFGKRFDAAMAVGLIFLLGKEDQAKLIKRVSNALRPNGRFLFSTPYQICEWKDALTGLPSQSLGKDAYIRLLDRCGLEFIASYEDEGENHYIEAVRRE